MDEHILVQSYNATSRRHAILSCDENSAWLYLHEPSSDPSQIQAVEFSGCAFNLIDPIQRSDIDQFRPAPPPIVESFATEQAVCKNVDAQNWSIMWSIDGLSVAVLRNDQPWCFLTPFNTYGYSRAISDDGPWGKPWSDSEFAELQWSRASSAG